LGSTRERWRRCWRFRCRPGTGGGGRRRVRSSTRLSGSSTRSWQLTMDGRRSNGTPRSGSLNGFVTSTATAAASPSSGTTCGGTGCSTARCLCRCGTIPVTRRWILVRRWRRSPGSSAKSTSLRWTCRTATPASRGPIRRRLPKHSAMVTTAHLRSSARCRARSCTTILSWRWRASWVTECASARGCSASCSPITCLPIGSAVPAKATTKARLRDWSAGSAATCWCLCRGRRAWRR